MFSIVSFNVTDHCQLIEQMRRLSFFVYAGLLVFVSGCALKEISSQADLLDNLSRLQGRIIIESEISGIPYVQLYQAKDQNLELIRKQILPGNKQYHFDVLPGTYMIGVFVDANDDKQWQPEESVSYLGIENSIPTPVTVNENNIVNIDTLTVKGPLQIKPDVRVQHALSKTSGNIGKIVSLDDPMFARENASMGFWRPFDFVEQHGGGLMMLQEYDVHKTPIVFIHGIFGISTEFEKVISELNQDNYQPWVLYYPSGVGLDLASDYFLQALNQLHAKYGYTNLILVAHSMGGLMTRSFVMKHQQSESAFDLSLVVTINSPMYGMDSAAFGVKTSPIVIPVWRDVASGSDYVHRVHAWRWPSEIPYHLIFSHLPGEDNDGVVPLESQVSPSLQQEAIQSHGFEAQHAEILFDPEFIKRLNEILKHY